MLWATPARTSRVASSTRSPPSWCATSPSSGAGDRAARGRVRVRQRLRGSSGPSADGRPRRAQEGTPGRFGVRVRVSPGEGRLRRRTAAAGGPRPRRAPSCWASRSATSSSTASGARVAGVHGGSGEDAEAEVIFNPRWAARSSCSAWPRSSAPSVRTAAARPDSPIPVRPSRRRQDRSLHGRVQPDRPPHARCPRVPGTGAPRSIHG